ncbi:MAG: hypothetical protein M3N12_10560 [Verrucomicrobiota bacterium]|nr:hypothetical protein [Verrucomicrobiota bacterium]
MNRDDDKRLWDLLGQAAEPKVSPFFSRNVVREIRQATGSRAPRRWFGLRGLIPATGVAVALALMVFLRSPSPVSSTPDSPADTISVVSAQDYEVIADLDDLLVSDDNPSWDDGVLL